MKPRFFTSYNKTTWDKDNNTKIEIIKFSDGMVSLSEAYDLIRSWNVSYGSSICFGIEWASEVK